MIEEIILNILEGFSISYMWTRVKIRKLYKWVTNLEKFRHIFLFYASIIGFVVFLLSLLFDLDYLILITYLDIYLLTMYITFNLIARISEVNEKQRLNKYECFKFLSSYIFIIISYIWIFASLYFFTDIFIKSHYFSLNNQIYILKPLDALFLSGITFISYDVGFFPEGILMKLFIFIEVFIAQILILGFLFIIKHFGKLLQKIKPTKDGKKIEIFKNKLSKIKKLNHYTIDEIIRIYKEIIKK